ncbi:MAG: porin [Thermonemataceae bacterium]|nr:porin [Thermonemataceae bacterium]
MKPIKKLFIAAVLLMSGHFVQAQGSDIYGKGIRINLDTTGTRYIRFITWHQLWMRYIDNNPGTTVNGLPEASTWDIGIRRSRLLWITQISPRYMILAHVGINNQTFVNGGASGSGGVGGYGAGKKPQLFLHDLWNEYTVVKDKLYFGTGLHYWNGISRMASASTLNFLALDAPIFNWPLIEETDQFARQIGMYVKGKLPLGKKSLDYRMYLNKPFATATPEATIKASPGQAFATTNNTGAVGGYFSLELAEKESNFLPFFVGTYVGTKKVINVGAGFHLHPYATKSWNATESKFEGHSTQIFGIDFFADVPLNKEKGNAFTGYLLYQNSNFGPNYVRSVGIMNEGGNGLPGSISQGGGNADWRIGTGSIVYAEAGYLLPKKTLGSKGKLQVFATGTYKNLEYLKDPALTYAAGFNYYIDGHHAKISLKYQNRAIYEGTFNNATGDKPKLNTNADLVGGRQRLGEVILQTMIYL